MELLYVIRVNLESNKTTKNIIDSIKHRGPDNQGFVNFQNLSLGSCRLSIFDLRRFR